IIYLFYVNYRWSLSCLDALPHYMKLIYKGLLDLYEEMEDIMAKEATPTHVKYAKEAMKEFIGSYMTEARWKHEGYVPTTEEHKSVTFVSSGMMDDVVGHKLPILNPNEFDLCKMRIEQYFLMTDYSLWEVILNGDSPIPTRLVEGLDQIHDRLQKLVSQLEIHRVSLYQEDVNLKFLHSLPSEWKTHTLIWRNTTDLEEQSLDDLFNSLKIYKAEVKHSSSTGTTTQNLAFVSSSNTDSTTYSLSTTASVSVVCVKLPVSSLPNIDSLSNVIDVDDLEEMDLRWQIAMLTMRARRFLQKTCRNLGDNGPTSIGFDMSKVEYYNCHRKGHFARECRSPKDSRRNGVAEPQGRTVPFETSTSNALVSQCDGVGSYDWSYQAEEEPANFALMAFSPSSSCSDNEVPSCSNACSKAYAQLHSQYDKLTNDFCKSHFDVISYQAGLESVEARLLVYKQNESVFEENIKLLIIEVKLRDTALVTLRQKLEKAEQERNDLKLNGGYHAVPPSTTGTFMPPKPDLVFHTAPIAVGTNHSAFTVQLSPSKPAQDLSYINRPTAPIIEDWVSDFEDESETKAPQIVPSFVQSSEQVQTPRHSVQPVETSILTASPKPTRPKSIRSGKRRNRKTCFVYKSVDHLIKDCDYHAKKIAQPTPRNYTHKGNNKPNASLTHKNLPKHMAPAAVLTQSKPISITNVRPVSAVVPKIMVTRPRLSHLIVTKSKSPIRWHITYSQSPKTSNLPPRVTVVQAPVGNPQYELKDKGVIDSGCSQHMTGNMSNLSNFKKLNGGYVAFEGNPKGGKITGKEKIKTGKLDFDDVYFVKELKFNLFSVSQMCDKKNSVLFTNTECLVLSPDFKLPDESQVLLGVPRENNMYNVNLKNIVPSKDLTCLFTKATIDESNLWHRRLGHINFKTINKLVKGESLSIHISLSLLIYNKKWINNIPPLPKYQSWIQENSSNGSSGYNNIFNMSNMPCGSKYKTARELWAAILKTFGGNEATKKTKKNLLKQQHGNFKAEGSETLEQMFNRLQVIIGQLQFMDIKIEQDDLNQKFLTSLASEWLMHTIVWRNRSDLDTMSLDDLYNHLKVYESEVQKKSEPNSQNMAFISSAKHSSGNEDGNTACVSTASTNVPTASASVATISQDTACAYIASQSSGSQIKFEDINQIDEDDIEEMDIKWNMALLSMRSYIENDEEDHALVADKVAPIEFALMANISAESKKLETLKEEKEGVDGKLAGLLKASKNLDNLIESQRSDKNKDGLGYSDVPPPPAQLYLSPKKDLSWTGIPECADDTVTDYSRPSLTVESTSGDD
nr:ribonuclease H-like domain-containing protein [Tanacetum cinerariifolium]